MQFGNKIRTLRKEKGLSQEALANQLHISFQAISKWENDLSLPDITLLPHIATIFGVSIDALFEQNEIESEKIKINEIIRHAFSYRESDPLISRKILLEGLNHYPANQDLLNNLLYVTDYTNYPDETISIALPLAEKTNDLAIKLDALRFLAYAYKAKGDLIHAEKALEQIPELYFTRLTEEAYLFDGKKKLCAAEKQKWISFDHLLQMMQIRAEYMLSNGNTKEALAETERALNLLAIMKNQSFDTYAAFFQKQFQKLSEKF